MKRSLILVLIIFYFCKFSIAQTVKDSIFIYEINNNEFLAILDSFITHEKQYEYFNKNVTMYLNILDSSGTCLQLSSGSTTDSLGIMEYDISANCGIFYYKSMILPKIRTQS